MSIPNMKGITLNGNGATITRNFTGTNAMIAVTTNSSAGSRITGFIFAHQLSSGPNSPRYISVGGGFGNAMFRIDHNTFGTCGGGDTTHVTISDSLGLIDHNSFTTTSGGEIIHIEAYGASSTLGWSYDVVPGGGDAVYVEDNTFTNVVSGNPAYFWGASAVQSYYGARTVFRYNICNMCQIDQHGTAGMVGARWWEIYENTFNVVPNGNQSTYMALRGGSGVIFNNHKTGATNLGAGGISLYEEDTGYPALYQVGRGKNQVLDPAYVWGNDSAMVVASGSSNVQVNRDFFLSPKPGYVPYTYPHPLAAGGTLPPPTNLRVTP